MSVLFGTLSTTIIPALQQFDHFHYLQITIQIRDADERVIERLEEQGKTAVIPHKRNLTTQWAYDKHLYKARHLI